MSHSRNDNSRAGDLFKAAEGVKQIPCASECASSQSVCPGVLMAFLLSHSVQEETQAFSVTWLSPSHFLLTLFVKQKPLPVWSHPLIPLALLSSLRLNVSWACAVQVFLYTDSTRASSRRPLSFEFSFEFLIPVCLVYLGLSFSNEAVLSPLHFPSSCGISVSCGWLDLSLGFGLLTLALCLGYAVCVS